MSLFCGKGGRTHCVPRPGRWCSLSVASQKAHLKSGTAAAVCIPVCGDVLYPLRLPDLPPCRRRAEGRFKSYPCVTGSSIRVALFMKYNAQLSSSEKEKIVPKQRHQLSRRHVRQRRGRSRKPSAVGFAEDLRDSWMIFPDDIKGVRGSTQSRENRTTARRNQLQSNREAHNCRMCWRCVESVSAGHVPEQQRLMSEAGS